MLAHPDLTKLSQQPGEWLRGSGPESDIVISSRIRLARNLAEFPFVRKCSEPDRGAIEKLVRDKLTASEFFGKCAYAQVERMDEVDRQLLVERQLISRELSEGTGARGVLIDPSEQFSVMVNEEDHLRVQLMRSGLDLRSAWDDINLVDDTMEGLVHYAFDERLGFLTTCPTNVGTGMRVSVMLHLPALVMTRHIEKVFRGLHKMSLAVRGLYGEGSQAAGDFYQISNQVTLGRSEEDLISEVADAVALLIDYERQARRFLIEQGRKDLHDRVSRAYGILCTAQTISNDETMQLLSSVRMGVNLGLIHDLEIPTVNKLFIYTQPA
ncbi:MAG TPA: protein arginine kinase, partial [Pirellulaceae bacterium]